MMTEYGLVEEKDKIAWDEVVTHPLQSWAWGEFRKQRQPISRLGRYEDGKLKKVFLIVWTKVPLLRYYFGYIPMGPVVIHEDIKSLKNEALKNHAIGIRMEPNVKKGVEINLPKGRNLFKPKTYWWDLTQSEEELLAKMHQKCRYNIKVAQKHDVRVNEDESGFENYLQLLFEGTVKRQKVGMHDENYHRLMKEKLGGMARLFTATFQGKIVSAMMVYVFKDTAYYAYGANSLIHKEAMAPTLLVWEVAKRMKGEGYKTFDLWGAEEGKGFSRFKEQFGAQMVEMAGTFDLAVNQVGYKIFRGAEEIRWRIRRWL